MGDIQDKLKGLLGDKVMTGSEWRSRIEGMEKRREEGAFEIEGVVAGEVVGNEEDGAFYLVRQDFPLDTLHGDVPLGAVLEAIPEHIALSACDEELKDFDPATTVFIDTETTGLAGGTGTVPFLIGLGYFVEGAFRLEQCFMRDFDEEEPMLAYLDGLFSRFDTVVSYNGKSYDMPLLRTRCIFNRIPFRLDGAMHFDLVHAARRFWKDRLGSCTLGNIETAILGIERHGDVPGYEIPEIWFNYVRSRDARKLEQVFYHHKMDILSLVTLTSELSRLLDAPDGQGFEHAQDKLSLLRIHFKQKRYEQVPALAKELLDSEAESNIRRECLELLAFSYKRQQDWLKMEEVLEAFVAEFPRDLLARHELAKLYEHRTRDLLKAETVCKETIAILETRAALVRRTDDVDWKAEGFKKRLARIQRKLKRGVGVEE